MTEQDAPLSLEAIEAELRGSAPDQFVATLSMLGFAKCIPTEGGRHEHPVYGLINPTGDPETDALWNLTQIMKLAFIGGNHTD